MVRTVVLGRFQPFHRGHAGMVKAALAHADSDEVVIAIGSSKAEASMRNPWSAAEREAMIRAWAAGACTEVEAARLTYCHVPDINDPPAWVKHATTFHGEGDLLTSDEDTAVLYEADGWTVVRVPLEARRDREGWRVRETARMLSTVADDDAVRTVLGPNVPGSVIEWLIEHDALYRLSLLHEGAVVG
jgi:cytidyltransferase-like protein